MRGKKEFGRQWGKAMKVGGHTRAKSFLYYLSLGRQCQEGKKMVIGNMGGEEEWRVSGGQMKRKITKIVSYNSARAVSLWWICIAQWSIGFLSAGGGLTAFPSPVMDLFDNIFLHLQQLEFPISCSHKKKTERILLFLLICLYLFDFCFYPWRQNKQRKLFLLFFFPWQIKSVHIY